MSYEYKTEREQLRTDSGMQMLLQVRDNVKRLLDTAGAFQADKAWKGVTGSSWTMLACLDYLVEIGEIVELPRQAWAQHRVFVSKP